MRDEIFLVLWFSGVLVALCSLYLSTWFVPLFLLLLVATAIHLYEIV